jgi:selenide,water dikinase
MSAPTSPPPRLTSLSHGAGCGCKLRPADLKGILAGLPALADKRVLVGPHTRDDAAIYRLSPTQALVATVDFFTPVVDDPFLFGRIAAANALSDVYAMGGTPRFALSIVAYPLATLGAETLGRIMAGATDACAEAGIEIVGGHSIDDPEPKFGLAVTGTVHPRRALTNAGARPGDRLLLTKPLGVGVATTAIKKNVDSPAIAIAIEQMQALNRKAGEAFAKAGVHALTDVTGFGLLGHLGNVVEASRVRARVRFADVPVIEGVAALVQAGIVPGGTRRNLVDVERWVDFPAEMPEWQRLVLADAQTNGGLLACVAADDAPGLVKRLARRGVTACEIGEVVAGSPRIVVV